MSGVGGAEGKGFKGENLVEDDIKVRFEKKRFDRYQESEI